MSAAKVLDGRILAVSWTFNKLVEDEIGFITHN
jgi:hypothetical protein